MGVLELRYRWVSPGIFCDAAGEQLHEEGVPPIAGEAVRFAYVVEDVEHDHLEAADQVRAWLLATGAASVELAAEVHRGR